jgi:hypothetical protein
LDFDALSQKPAPAVAAPTARASEPELNKDALRAMILEELRSLKGASE